MVLDKNSTNRGKENKESKKKYSMRLKKKHKAREKVVTIGGRRRNDRAMRGDAIVATMRRSN